MLPYFISGKIFQIKRSWSDMKFRQRPPLNLRTCSYIFFVLHFKTLHRCIYQSTAKSTGMFVYILKICSFSILNSWMWFNLRLVLDVGFSTLSFFFITHDLICTFMKPWRTESLINSMHTCIVHYSVFVDLPLFYKYR